MNEYVKELFFATKNKDKILKMKNRLEGLNIKIITPYDIDLNININENGTNVIENATIKAKAYYEAVKIPTVATDSALYVEKFIHQPGLFVKRINNITLNDNELEKHYVDELNKIGGKSKAFYITGLALVQGEDIYSVEIKEDEFLFISNMCNDRRTPDPLSRLEFDEKLNKYFCQLTINELKAREYVFDNEARKFIETHLK